MRTAYLFPGQGSQRVGMGYDLYQSEPRSRAVFDQADAQLGYALSRLCFFGPEETLTDTVHQQPALYVTSIAALRAMQELGWEAPDFVAGHSLGELSALTAANSLDFSAGLALVQTRGRLMKEAGEKVPGAMAAVLALSIDEVGKICKQVSDENGLPVQIANDNCPGQIVISGDKSALDKAMTLAEAAGAKKVIPLPISIAAHSALMASAASAFAEAVSQTAFSPPDIPVIGNVSAAPLSAVDQIRQELNKQLTMPVRWTESMRYLLDQGVNTFVEVGSGDVLLGLLKRIDRQAKRVKFELPVSESEQ